MVMVRQFDEEILLDRVLDVFWARGWQATSMAGLADATHVQRGSLYHAYGGKAELFILAFDRYAKRVLHESRTALQGKPIRVALRNFFDISIASMTLNTPARGCFTTKTAMESSLIGPGMRDRIRTLLEELEDVVVERLSCGDARGSLRTQPDEAARIIMTFTRGLAVMERVYHDPERLHMLGDSLVDLLVESGTAS